MKNLSDEELVVLYAQGENMAFDELLLRHKASVYNYVLSIVRNRDLAEDLFQDIFTKVIVTIKSGQYNESGKFLGFLFRVAKNKVIDVYRHEQSFIQINEGDVEYDLFSNQEICTAFDEHIPSREEKICYYQTLNDLRRMIKYLPVEQRNVVVMRYYKNLTFKEISEILNISINTALGRLRYALGNLRRLADEHDISLAV